MIPGNNISAIPENSSFIVESLHDFLNTMFIYFFKNEEKKCVSFYPVEQNFKKRNNKNNISIPASKLQFI